MYVDEDDFKGTRLVFEWNDPETEFDLQFINPKNQHYEWRHNLAESPTVIEREKYYRYSVMEEFLDGSQTGIWKVNVKYLGNKSLMPTYLKAIIYHDYGFVTQRKEIKVFKLALKDVYQELFTVSVNEFQSGQ